MKTLARFSVALSAAWMLAGCASRPPAPAATQPTTLRAATRTSADDPAMKPLDQIQPVPVLPMPKRIAATQPAPLDAIQWYAQARAALLASPPQRAKAIELLEKAAAADPNSAEIQEELGKAYGAQPRAAAAFQKALELDPDNLDLYERLGRQYLIQNKLDEALSNLRLATLTTQYKQDPEAAAIIDFFLARTLQRKGYDRAALDCYALLLQRIDAGVHGFRSAPELAGLASQPQLIYAMMAELYDRHGQHAEAVDAYQRAAAHAPDNFDLQSRLARSMIMAGKTAEGLELGASLVSRFRANSESLKLLHELYKMINREGDVADALAKLRQARPDDKSLLFALSDALLRENRAADAEKLLADAVRRTGDFEVVKRLFAIYEQRDDTEACLRLLIQSLAQDPDSLRQMSPMWAQLLNPARRRQLRLGLLQKLKVAPQEEAARLFFVSRVAQVWNRDALARSALEQGAAIRPHFAPICRSLISDYWSRPDWDDQQKIQTCEKLIQAVRDDPNPGLATELEGLSLLNQKGKAEEAARKFEEALKLGNKSPDVQHTQAIAMLAASEGARAESLLWKVISDWPNYEDAYETLFGYYLGQGQPSRAINVLGKWLSADPGNLKARLWRVRVMAQASHPEAAESELVSLFNDDPRNGQVLAVMRSFYSAQGKIAKLITLLEEERKAHPDNREAAELLVSIYHQQKRPSDALRVLDATRDAVKNDPDLLYYVAHVYGRIGRKDTEEKLLEDVLKLDPRHAPSANDLGYSWADEGRNLARAEELIRIAVEAEPDNQSFLDSLGWVLYKRSKFAEASVYFQRALGPATRPDPVVLDHMGDVLYRLGRKDDAMKNWKWAARRLEERGESVEERDDIKKLREDLKQKFKQFEANQPVTVAPVAGEK